MEPEVFESMLRVQSEHWWFSARRDILACLIEPLGMPAGAAEILEVGCGTGANLPMLKQFGQVYGMEMNPMAREAASRLGAGTIRDGWLPDGMAFPSKTFDLICLLDVLEHIQDDRAALQALHGHLKPGASVLITVPAYPWMWSQHDVVHHHFRRYRASELRSLAEQTGFRCLRIGHFNTLLFPVIAAVRLLQKWRWMTSAPGASDAEMPSPLVNRVLRQVFRSERGLLRHAGFPVGTSIFAVLRT